MAFTTPRTWVSGEIVNAAQMNQDVRDNVSDLNSRTVVNSHVIASAQTTTSTSYTDLSTVGPTVTLTTGTQAMLNIKCGSSNNTAAARAAMGFAVSGASSVAASDTNAFYHDSNANALIHASMVLLVTGLTAGSNTFTAKYRVTSGTGTFRDRELTVWPGNKLS